MATYTELFDLGTNATLRNKIAVANQIAAVAIIAEVDTVPNHTERVQWATQVFSSPSSWAERMLHAVLADNDDLTVAQITGAGDGALLTSVEKMVDAFAANL